MTRLAVLADIHGNLPALEAVMRDMAQFKLDGVIVAGDIINWGPFSAEVMEVVVREGWAVIRGNNEFYLLDYNTARQPQHWKDYTLLPWLYEQLAGRWHQVIAAWPDELSLRFPDAPTVRLVHGWPGDPWAGIHPLLSDQEIAARLETVEESALIGAHTHLAMSRRVGRWHLLNPGSVGMPIDGKAMAASYLLLEGDERGWHPIFRRVPFELERVLAEFERQRFVERCGVTAALVVREFETARLQVHPFNQWRKALYDGQPESDDMLAEFLKVDAWPYTPSEYHVNRG